MNLRDLLRALSSVTPITIHADDDPDESRVRLDLGLEHPIILHAISRDRRGTRVQLERVSLVAYGHGPAIVELYGEKADDDPHQPLPVNAAEPVAEANAGSAKRSRRRKKDA